MNYQRVQLLLVVLSILSGVLDSANTTTTTTSEDRSRKQGKGKSSADNAQHRSDEMSDEYFMDQNTGLDKQLSAYGDDSMQGFPFEEEEEEGFGDDEVVYTVKSGGGSVNDSVNGLLITKVHIASMPLRSKSIEVCLNKHCQPAQVFKDKGDYVILSIKKERHEVQAFATLKEGEKYECLANYVALIVNVVREQNTVKCTPECTDGMVLTCDHKPAGLVRVKGDANRFYSAEELFVAAMEREWVPGAPSPPKQAEEKPSESREQKMRSSDAAGTMMTVGFLPTVSLLFRSKSYALF